MSNSELQSLIKKVVEEKLDDFLGYPDVGLELRSEVVQRLLQQKAKVDAGERGIPMIEVMSRLGTGRQ